MLIDHIAQHAMRLLLPNVVADAAAAPWDLFPNHDAEFVAEIEDDARLLIMREPDEVRAHVLDHLHLFAQTSQFFPSRELSFFCVAAAGEPKDFVPTAAMTYVLRQIVVPSAAQRQRNFLH